MSSWLAPFRPGRDGPFDRAAAVHLLRRTAFGHRPAEIEAVLAAGPRAAAEALVRGRPPDEAERRAIALGDHALRAESPGDFAAAWFLRLLVTRHPLSLRMQLLWHDHFATSVRKVRRVHWMAQQFAVFERHGLGSFADLLRAVVEGPAMLVWLDAPSNRRGHPNENLARELLELFALGRGHYTERDVQEAARALTGWRVLRGRLHFDRRRHDAGVKEILGRRGRFDGRDLLAIVLEQEACPAHVADRLLRAFVGPRYPRAARAELAALLRREHLHVGRALSVLLASRLFYRAEQRATRVRGPIAYLAWLLRSLPATAAPAALYRAAARMGQRLLDPPDVGGWDGEEGWLSSAAWLARVNCAHRLGRPGGPFFLRPALEDLVPRGAPEDEAQFLAARLFPEGVPSGAAAVLAERARAERGLPRPVRLAGLLGALGALPAAHRF